MAVSPFPSLNIKNTHLLDRVVLMYPFVLQGYTKQKCFVVPRVSIKGTSNVNNCFRLESKHWIIQCTKAQSNVLQVLDH